uniref:phosphatidate cytidylyltransferase n=1 Tax=Lygus hesperus TaxID=30085 RepID=A0A0A9Y2Q6_LYGHE
MIVQGFMFKEIINLAYLQLLSPSTEIHIPLFRTQNWYWYFVGTYFTYGRIFKRIFSMELPYHMFTSFILFAVGFVSFVLGLKPGMYRTQFCMFAWLWSALSFIVLQSTLIIYNLFRGLYWFLFPIILIICNDTWAYV